mgnify:CR=1 FL=1
MQSLLIFLFRLLSENKKVLAEALSYFYGNFVSIVIKLRKYNQKLLISVTSVFLFAIFASVNFVLLIGKNKYLVKALLDGSDAAWVLTFDDVCDLFWKFQDPFLNDLLVFDDVDGDVVIDETEDVQVEVLDRAFYLDDVLDTHFVALGILDDGNGAVKFVEFQVMINSHGFAGLDMVKYETFVKCSNV